ncbi:MAG: ribosome recycling factor [Candidatus Berkelbacteria bacterium]|nr:ribosome recycling factor [Candidatus Berkelbacteria bacterium]
MIKEVMKTIGPKMDASIANFELELKNIRTGRASAGLVEDIVVSYYGANTPLKQMASISVPEPTMLAVTPWDKQSLGDIENAIKNAELGLSIVNDGNAVRISLPPLTGERREELSKQAQKSAEAARVALRNIRGEAWEKIQNSFKNKEISEDEKYRGEKELNELIEKKNKSVEEISAAKIAELKTI